MATSEELERRVRIAENEIEGEKVVSRYVLQQIRANNDNVIGLKTDVAALTLRVGHLTDDMTVANAALRNHGMLLTMLQQDVGALRLDATELRRGQEAINARLDQMDTRFDQLQAQFNQMQQNVAAILVAVAPRT